MKKLIELAHGTIHENNKRSIDLWKELVDVVERNNSRPNFLAQKYFGNDVFNALDNLLKLINKTK